MSEWEELAQAKIKARERLNSLAPEQAQKIVNEVIAADLWQPDTFQAIDWDNSLPVPKSLMSDEANP